MVVVTSGVNAIEGECCLLYTSRQAVMNGDPVRAAEAYLSKSFEGNLMDLLDMFAPTNSCLLYTSRCV